MQVNQSPAYHETKKIVNTVTKKIFDNYKNATNKREATYEEAMEDVEYMVQIHQLVQTMLERANSRILPNNQD